MDYDEYDDAYTVIKSSFTLKSHKMFQSFEFFILSHPSFAHILTDVKSVQSQIVWNQ